MKIFVLVSVFFTPENTQKYAQIKFIRLFLKRIVAHANPTSTLRILGLSLNVRILYS